MPRARPLLLLLAALLAAQRGAALTLKLFKNKECTGIPMTKALTTGACYAGFALMQCSSTDGTPWVTIEWFNDTTYCKGQPRGAATVYGAKCVPFWPQPVDSPILGNVQLWAVISEPTCASDPLALVKDASGRPLVLKIFSNTNCNASNGTVLIDFPSTAQGLSPLNPSQACHDGRSLATISWTDSCPRQRFKYFSGCDPLWAASLNGTSFSNCNKDVHLCNSTVSAWRGRSYSLFNYNGLTVTAFGDSVCGALLYAWIFPYAAVVADACYAPGKGGMYFYSSPVQGATLAGASFMFVAPQPFSVGAQASLGTGKLPGLDLQYFVESSCVDQRHSIPVYPGECSAGRAVLDYGGNWSDPFGTDQVWMQYAIWGNSDFFPESLNPVTCVGPPDGNVFALFARSGPSHIVVNATPDGRACSVIWGGQAGVAYALNYLGPYSFSDPITPHAGTNIVGKTNPLAVGGSNPLIMVR